ncbi:MAG: hypothetical protein NPIRA02_18260 [Nitrospirales bacterium]|nr:MAG: hypothetical protein NPIRA02_18260 [Nitrospirales bacterium]
MNGLRFERKGEGDYYKLILHIGDCYVPVSDDIIEVLTQQASAPADQFLSVLLDKVGYSSYLKEQIQTELAKGGNTSAQINALQQALASA